MTTRTEENFTTDLRLATDAAYAGQYDSAPKPRPLPEPAEVAAPDPKDEVWLTLPAGTVRCVRVLAQPVRDLKEPDGAACVVVIDYADKEALGQKVLDDATLARSSVKRGYEVRLAGASQVVQQVVGEDARTYTRTCGGGAYQNGGSDDRHGVAYLLTDGEVRLRVRKN